MEKIKYFTFILFLMILPAMAISQENLDIDKSKQLMELMQDSTMLHMMMDHMASNEEMRHKMMQKMMESNEADCSEMMNKCKMMKTNHEKHGHENKVEESHSHNSEVMKPRKRHNPKYPNR